MIAPTGVQGLPLVGLKGVVLYSTGDLAYYQDDYAIARARFEECIVLCRSLELTSELASALGATSMLLFFLNPLSAKLPTNTLLY